MRRLALITLVLAGGCASKRAAYTGIAAGATITVAGAIVTAAAYGGNHGTCDSECSARILMGIVLLGAGVGTLGVSASEAISHEPSDDASERAALIGRRAQQLARAHDCPLVEGLGEQVRAMEGGERLYERFVALPNVSGCLHRLERMRNKAAAWELTKRAATAARANDCSAAAAAGPQVLELDHDFHNTVFLGDAAIFACLQSVAMQVTAVEAPPAAARPAAQRPRSSIEALNATAVHRARSGDCDTVRIIARRVREVDETYYANVFVANGEVAGCVAR